MNYYVDVQDELYGRCAELRALAAHSDEGRVKPDGQQSRAMLRCAAYIELAALALEDF